MSTFRLYLWREWREHRVALLAVVAILAAMAAGWRFLAPARILHSSIFVSVACLVAVTIGLLAVGGELLAERRAGGLGWLQRLPAGLGTPFRVKLAFLAASSVGIGLAGIALAYVTAWTRGVAPEGIAQPRVVLLLAALFALWTFAASAWSSRSVLALFGAAFVLAGLGMPVWILTTRGYRPEPWEIGAGAVLLFAGALPSAWLGFVTAGRFGRGPGLSVVLGFSSAVASFLPFWGWGLWQVHLRERLDRFDIRQAVVTCDQRIAFVQVVAQNERWDPEALPRIVLRVNLEDGSSEVIRRGEAWISPARMCDADGRVADNVFIHDRKTQDEGVAFYLASGAPMGWNDRVLLASRCPERRGWLHARPPFRLDSSMTDAFTGKVVYPHQLGLPRDACIWSDLGIWYVISSSEGAFLLDPHSGGLKRAEWLDGVTEDFGPRLPDGRFFAPLREGGIGLADPQRAQVTKIAGAQRDSRVYRAIGLTHVPFEVGESVLLRTDKDTYHFDPQAETFEVVPFLRVNRPIGSTSGGAVFVLTRIGLVRFDIESGLVKPLFPRGDEFVLATR